MQNTDSFYRENSKFIFGMNFEVSDIADSVERSVWNLESAIGTLGGLYAIIELLVRFILNPFIHNEMTQQLVSDTVVGKSVKLQSRKFKIKRILDNILCCPSLKRKWIYNLEYEKQIRIFNYYTFQINNKLNLF